MSRRRAIDPLPVDRLIDYYIAQSRRGLWLNASTVAMELKHALEEGRQNEIIARAYEQGRSERRRGAAKGLKACH